MQRLNPYLLLLFTKLLSAQLQGYVMDENQEPLQDVSVHLKGTYKGTVTNKDGLFFLDVPGQSAGTLQFSYLGYDTVSESYSLPSETIQIQLKTSPLSLSEVAVSSKENPAHAIIRNAQRIRKIRADNNQIFTADFYSRGMFRMDSVPEKFMGVDIGDIGGSLDSTRSGIVYLSETKSKIFQNKKDFKEVVYASKVSGDDNGFSFNSAQDAEFDFYQNTLDFGVPIASPIGNGAFTYYRFTLEESFYTPEKKLINKIKITPKTETGPAFKGYVYIVEDDWLFYGVNVIIEKQRMRIPGMDQMQIIQQYQFNAIDQRWSLSNQVLDFKFSFFAFKGNGRFSAVYSNYDFSPLFAPKTFGAALQRFEETANKKGTPYWDQERPIRLTDEEAKDYQKKDSIQQVRKTPQYLDSIDGVKNKFKWANILGKTIQNSRQNTAFTYRSPLTDNTFNPIQGLALGINLGWNKEWEEEKKELSFKTGLEYGLSDTQWYPRVQLNYLMNSINYSRLVFRAEKSLSQFDDAPAINETAVELSTLLYKNNWARYYERTRIGGNWQGYLFPSLFASYNVHFEKRATRINTTQYSIGFPDRRYAENIPDNVALDFENHDLIKHTFRLQYRHQQKYYENPRERFYTFDNTQPKITLELEQAFASSLEKYNYLKLDLYWLQEFEIGALGNSKFAFRLGHYLKKDRPSFADFTHFHGNEIILRNTALRSFQLLSYYQKSTAEDYALAHWEHDFYKWGLGSWPVFKQLQASLTIGGNSLFIAGDKPYFEAFIGLGNLGIKKLRFLRVDYVRSFGDIFRKDGIRIGLDLF
jgi:hypothetical protein